MDLKWFNYRILDIDLTNGLNEAEYDINGESVYYDSGVSTIKIRVNDITRDPIPLNQKQRLTFPHFRKLFITATAAAETITLFISIPSEVKKEGQEVVISNPLLVYATDINIYNIVNTLAATDYSQALTNDCKGFTITPIGGDLMFNFTNSGVGAYVYLNDGQSWSVDKVSLTGKTLHFQSATALSRTEITEIV